MCFRRVRKESLNVFHTSSLISYRRFLRDIHNPHPSVWPNVFPLFVCFSHTTKCSFCLIPLRLHPLPLNTTKSPDKNANTNSTPSIPSTLNLPLRSFENLKSYYWSLTFPETFTVGVRTFKMDFTLLDDLVLLWSISFLPHFVSGSSKTVLNGTFCDIRDPWTVSSQWVTGNVLTERQMVKDRSSVAEVFIRASSAGFSLSVSYRAPFSPLNSHFVKVYSLL
jgi:hypothetical protein